MGFHTYPVARADELEEAAERYRYVSAEELVGDLSPGPTAVVADLGSGTGFYTDDVAPHVGHVHAVDVQPGMHARYREKGVPPNVSLVVAAADVLPFADDGLDAAFTTMSYHEFGGSAGAAELARAIRAGGRLVVFDWRAGGTGTVGPPVDERFAVEEAVEHLEHAGFGVEAASHRPETLRIVATAP